MNIVGIIPARMNSSRFPGKPLVKINGTPMIGQVYRRVKKASILNDVYVATCDEVIRDYIQSIGGEAIMTKDTHERCTDRTAEALLEIEKQTGEAVDIVVMVQGDEPLVTEQMVEDAVGALLKDSGIQIVNVMAPIQSVEEFDDPNEIKVVVDNNGFALYFSREAVPSRKRGGIDTMPMFKQVCVIPFLREFLTTVNELPQTSLEIAESIDMLRVLEHGYKIKMVETQDVVYSVDTPEDLKRVEQILIA